MPSLIVDMANYFFNYSSHFNEVNLYMCIHMRLNIGKGTTLDKNS